MINFILDYASPTSINTTTAQAPTGFLRQVLVAIKSDADDTAISTLTSKPTTSISRCVDGLFDGGLARVSYIKLNLADLTGFNVSQENFTILFDGYSEAELSARDLGDFEGVIGFETSNTADTIENKVCKMYSTNKDGYTLGYTFGLGLSNVVWSNLQYLASNKAINFVTDLGTANLLYDNKISAWARDDVVGLRLISFFVGGEPFTKPYIEKEIAINLQTNNLNLLASGLDYTKQDCAIVKNFNSDYINKFYVASGLINGFDYSVDLTTDNEFLSTLEVDPTIPVWKILMNIKGVL